MLVPRHVDIASRLCGRSPSWADYARYILEQAHDVFADHGSRMGTGPWYVARATVGFCFVMRPFSPKSCYPSFRVLNVHDSWIFEVFE